ncbi:hypothetical protein [uncultured Roseivirga sp.]|uniref:hypothetical protein n=1 Tax=uncultured Roseivirga sp. TaxID=543088 RepID=UPI0030DC7C8C|tara:strand:+ start:205011 stop:205589 length:579 start_codon:yes stop_codon:yes gene_type:complete
MFSKILEYTDLGMTGLNILFFPVDEGAKMAEADAGIISTATTVMGGVGAIMALVSTIHNQNAHWTIKWIAVPLILLHVGALVVLFGIAGSGGVSQFKVLATKGLTYSMPIINGLHAGYIIYEMISDSKANVNARNIGQVIYKMPAILSYPPVNKHPFFAIVILVRTGGLITTSVGGMIELLHEGQENKKIEE